MNRICFAGLVLVLAGCRSAKPPPPVPMPVAVAERNATQAAKLSAEGNWSGAAGAWERALSEYRLLNDRTNEAIALHNLGEAREQLGSLDSAHQLLEEAASINAARKADEQWWRNQIALLQIEAKAHQTNVLSERFARLESRSGNLKGTLRGLFLNERGLWQTGRREFEKADADYVEAFRLFAAVDDGPGMAAVISNEALLLERQEKFQAAADKWRDALARFEKMSNPLGIAISMLGRGRALVQAKQNAEEARDLLQRANRNFKTLHQESEASEAAELLKNLGQKS